MRTLLLLITVLIGFQAPASILDRSTSIRNADNCGNVDESLRKAFGPPRSQGDIGWCYANAAADLLTYQFRDDLHGQRVSSSHIALTFNKEIFGIFGGSESEGGMASFALNLSQFKGLCPQKIEDEVRYMGTQLPLKKRIQGLIYLKQNFDRTQGESLRSDLRKYYSQNKSILTRMPLEDLRSILQNSSERNFVANFADYFCQGRKVVPQHKRLAMGMLKYASLNRTEPLMDKLHDYLDQNKPVIIDYFADFFDADNAKMTNASRHTSIVVGRRWNQEKNQCEVLIRNSWGKRCDGYAAPSLKNSCDEGHLWVSDKVLSEYIFGVVYFL
jgi:hypothetical protein